MTRLTVQAADVPDGGMKTYEVGERKVLVTRDGDAYHAFDALCPHARANLGQGLRCGDRVICPWHHATFHAGGGGLIEPPALQGLKAYAVTPSMGGCEVDLDVVEPRPEPAPVGAPDDHTLIVGGGAAGFMTAQTLRAGGYAGRVTLLTSEDRPPYDRTALSKAYLSGKKEADALPLGGADWAEKQRVELRSSVKVDEIDLNTHTVRLAGGEQLTGTRLVVATGGTPRPLEMPGSALEGVHVLRSLADAQALKKAAKGKRLVIVGTGFIGLEAAASLVGEGGAASVVVVGEQAEVLTKALSPRVGRALRALHESKGVQFRLKTGVESIEGQQRVEAVHLKSGERLPADLVLAGTGITPNSQLLGAKADEKGAVRVDDRLQVAPQVYALGDLALAPSALGEVRVEHWRVALQHGMVAAASILEQPNASAGARVPFFWTQQYGKSLRSVGHADSLDQTHLWGEPEQLDFLEFVFEKGQTVAVSGMNRDRDLAALEELFRQGRAPSEEKVRSGPFDLAAEVRPD